MFLSTPPSRVATWRGYRQLPQEHVSIHATLAGGDASNKCFRAKNESFYPRHPRGWRRYSREEGKAYMMVSIHATLAGGDHTLKQTATANFCFYPRHPRGWRQTYKSDNYQAIMFLSTPPSRVATR